MNLNYLALIKDIDRYNKIWTRTLCLKRAVRKEPSQFKSSPISTNVFHALATTLWSVGLTSCTQLAGSPSLAPEL